MSGIDRVVPRFAASIANGDLDCPKDWDIGPRAGLVQPTVGQFSSNEIRYLILIATGFDVPDMDGQYYAEATGRFTKHGLIEYPVQQANPSLTARGHAFIRMLLATPLPEESYADPRTGKRV